MINQYEVKGLKPIELAKEFEKLSYNDAKEAAELLKPLIAKTKDSLLWFTHQNPIALDENYPLYSDSDDDDFDSNEFFEKHCIDGYESAEDYWSCNGI